MFLGRLVREVCIRMPAATCAIPAPLVVALDASASGAGNAPTVLPTIIVVSALDQMVIVAMTATMLAVPTFNASAVAPRSQRHERPFAVEIRLEG